VSVTVGVVCPVLCNKFYTIDYGQQQCAIVIAECTRR